jgi:hypothetical protein
MMDVNIGRKSIGRAIVGGGSPRGKRGAIAPARPFHRASAGALALALALAAAQLLAAPPPAPLTFATGQEAVQALIDAARNNDGAAMLKLFGPEGKDIVQSGDAAEDKAAREEFARRAAEKMNIVPEPGNPNRATLVVGENDWPFPVPLLRSNGRWAFDAAEGRMEILARRIGRNEMNAIEVCRGYVEAQMEYAAHDRDANGVLEYAQKIVGSPGKKDGLYWEGEPDTLAPKAFADAAAVLQAAQGKKPVPYHGYYFHILKAQGPEAPGGAADYLVKNTMIGGFALVAWPDEYAVSGVKTFIVNHLGVVYEKDLGPTTSTMARTMTVFNPGKGWNKVEGE